VRIPNEKSDAEETLLVEKREFFGKMVGEEAYDGEHLIRPVSTRAAFSHRINQLMERLTLVPPYRGVGRGTAGSRSPGGRPVEKGKTSPPEAKGSVIPWGENNCLRMIWTNTKKSQSEKPSLVKRSRKLADIARAHIGDEKKRTATASGNEVCVMVTL